jgi:glucuronoarabinoxylan endo-1,4-beta-xylanase
MDGFGAAEAFIPTITAAQADLFFSTTSGIGLSMLRLGIAPDGTLYSGSWGTAQMALARNASLTIWGAPWSPPTSAKTTGNTTTGSILPADYGSWASTLAAFVTAGRKNNVPVAFISAQNEPDYNTNGAYDMCLYDQNQMTSFVKVLGPALAGLNPAAGLIMPEPSSWGNLWGGTNYVGTVMADSTAAGLVNVIASHQYSVSEPPSHAVPAGKRMWETEVSDFGTFDASIGNAVTVATWIHNAIIDGGVNAWHYWWLVNQNADNEGLVGKNGDASLTKRVFAMGNFSRFVRPGWVRIGTTGTVSGLLVSAYKDATTGDFAIVAVNTTSASVTATFGITGPVFSSVAAYVTSGTAVGNIGTDGNMSQGSTSGSIPMSITASMNAFSANVPVGVETFVGKAQ